MVFQEGIVYIYVIMLPSQSAKMALFMVVYDDSVKFATNSAPPNLFIF